MKSAKLIDEIEQKLAELETLKEILKRIKKNVKFEAPMNKPIDVPMGTAFCEVDGVDFVIFPGFNDAFNDLETFLN